MQSRVVLPHQGNFIALNTIWPSTAKAGGRQWACPSCGEIYAPGRSRAIPHFVYVLQRMNTVVFSEWGETAEESAIGGLMELNAGVVSEYNALSDEELFRRMHELVDRFRAPSTWRPFSMSQRAVDALTGVNAARSRKPPFSWDHLPPVFDACFVRFVAGQSPVMTKEDTKRMLAMLLRTAKM